MAAAIQLFLIRHAKTAGNLEHRYVGRTDEPLCGAGVQAFLGQMESYRRLLRGNTGELSFVVSPMKRCVQTAELLASGIGCENALFVRETALCEMDFGAFEYCNYAQLNGNPAYQRYIDSNGESGFPGAETLSQFCARTADGFLRQIHRLERQQAKKAVFVVHGGTIMAVLAQFAQPAQDYFSWQVKNGCGYAARWNEAGFIEGAKIIIP